MAKAADETSTSRISAVDFGGRAPRRRRAAMITKPQLDGVIDRFLAALEDGCLSPFDQRELAKLLRHKLSGKHGVPAWWPITAQRRFLASVRKVWIHEEIARLKAAGPRPRGGYREAAMTNCAARLGFDTVEALQRWLSRNR
jgi:hypothetical protein